jgi:hypothetical protein
MTQWIPFAEGEYLVDQAYLLTSDNSAAALENVIIEVYSDRQGKRHLKGHCRVRNMLMIELLEDNDDLDLLLDFGDEFKYLLKAPDLNAGKGLPLQRPGNRFLRMNLSNSYPICG